MTEQSKFLPVGSIPVYGDGIGVVTLYDASHANETEEQRIHTVTTIASLAYGNEEAKNPEALYERMKSIKHESLWEFIRIGSGVYTTLEHSMRNLNLVYDTSKEGYSSKKDVQLHKQNIACFRIKVPMFVRAQFMRHRSFSYLEMSRRYTKGSKVPFDFWTPPGMLELHDMTYAEYQQQLMDGYSEDCKTMETQVASRFLPQTTYTELYVMGEVEGLRNFFRLRLDSHAQAEIREVAASMLALLKVHQPDLYEKVKLQGGAE
jgi:thymidylate synthase (FAD)